MSWWNPWGEAAQLRKQLAATTERLDAATKALAAQALPGPGPEPGQPGEGELVMGGADGPLPPVLEPLPEPEEAEPTSADSPKSEPEPEEPPQATHPGDAAGAADDDFTVDKPLTPKGRHARPSPPNRPRPGTGRPPWERERDNPDE